MGSSIQRGLCLRNCLNLCFNDCAVIPVFLDENRVLWLQLAVWRMCSIIRIFLLPLCPLRWSILCYNTKFTMLATSSTHTHTHTITIRGFMNNSYHKENFKWNSSWFIFPFLLSWKNCSSSLNMGDTENVLNNYLSTLNTKLERAAMALIFVQELSPLLSTLTCCVCCPIEKQEKQSKKANGLLKLIKTSLSWTHCTASTSFFLFCFFFLLFRILFSPFSLSPLPIAYSSLLWMRTHAHVGHFFGKKKPFDAKLGTWQTGAAKRKGKARHHAWWWYRCPVRLTPSLSIYKYLWSFKLTVSKAFSCFCGVSHFTPRWIIADQVSNYVSVIKAYTYC